MDEFSSKTVCVMTKNWKKLKLMSFPVCNDPENENSEKFLDEFSIICQ